MNLKHPIPAEALPRAATLYWEAFGPKLERVLGPTEKAVAYTKQTMDPTHGFSVHDPEGHLLGVAGFKTQKSALVNGDFRDLKRTYGAFGAIWRMIVFSLLQRDVENRRFLIDGIFVDPAAQGQGIGTILLRALCDEANVRGYRAVRLDVLSSNQRARALYLREGFEDLRINRIGILRHAFGFSTSTTMVKQL